MVDLFPFEIYLERAQGTALPLPSRLGRVYGDLVFPHHPGRPYVITNFVSSLDGVVTLGVPGYSGGGDISGFNAHDQALMGILRAAADAVIVGASQLRRPPGTLWTPSSIFPALADEYSQLRRAAGKQSPHPLQVIITASGRLDVSLPIFHLPEVEVFVITTPAGEAVLRRAVLPATIKFAVIESAERAGPIEILAQLQRITGPDGVYLIEGGPRLAGMFFEAGRLDELFLTVAPQVAGRDESSTRPGFVSDIVFAPKTPLWGELVSLRRAGSHLFLRYQFQHEEVQA